MKFHEIIRSSTNMNLIQSASVGKPVNDFQSLIINQKISSFPKKIKKSSLHLTGMFYLGKNSVAI